MASEPSARVIAHELRLSRSEAPPAFFHGLTMRPHLVEGDLVETEPISAEDVRVGDVVTYRYEDKFPTRRVVAHDRSNRTFTIMGDGIPGWREYVVPEGDVLARVTRRQREGTWLAVTDAAWRWQTVKVRLRVWAHHSRLLGPVRWATRPLRR